MHDALVTETQQVGSGFQCLCSMDGGDGGALVFLSWLGPFK